MQIKFSIEFSLIQTCMFRFIFAEIYYWGSNLQQISIGASNGSAANRRQAITCNNGVQDAIFVHSWGTTIILISSTWWHHQMETFSGSLAICAGNSPVPGDFPTQRPVTRSFDVFFDLCLNKRLSKEPWGWWCETLKSLFVNDDKNIMQHKW